MDANRFDPAKVKPEAEWNLSANDLTAITDGLKEIEAYEEFHRGTPEEDPEEDFETIRRKRKQGGS